MCFEVSKAERMQQNEIYFWRIRLFDIKQGIWRHYSLKEEYICLYLARTIYMGK